MAELKNRLKQAMDERAIRQVDICEALNIPKSALSQYLSGKSNKMDTERLHSLALYLGKSEAWLMGYEDDKNVSVDEDRNNVMSVLGKNIKLQRERLGITQEDLAIKMGYKSKTTIAKIETGVNDVNQSKLIAFAEALETSPSYLIGWTDKNKGEEIIDKYNRLSKNEEKDYKKVFSTNLDYYLKKNNMSQVELANKLGVSKQAVNYWLAEKKMPRMNKVEEIARIFGIKNSELLDNIRVNYVLSSDEEKIIYFYRMFNSVDKEKLNAFMEFLYLKEQEDK